MVCIVQRQWLTGRNDLCRVSAYSDAGAYSEIINDNSSLMHGAQVEAIASSVTL